MPVVQYYREKGIVHEVRSLLLLVQPRQDHPADVAVGCSLSQIPATGSKEEVYVKVRQAVDQILPPSATV